MLGQQLVLYEEEFNQITALCERLNKEANAIVVFLVDKNGQLVSHAGDVADIDTTSLASLTAGNIAATGGLAKILGEDEFSELIHQGNQKSLHITLVASRIIMVVIFDKRASLGLVKLRVKKAAEQLELVFQKIQERAGGAGAQTPFAEITDDDIDSLFND